MRLTGDSQEKNDDSLHLISIGETAEILKGLHLLFSFLWETVSLWGCVSSREQKFTPGFPLWENHVCVCVCFGFILQIAGDGMFVQATRVV